METQLDTGSDPGLGRSPGEGNGSPFEYSCLKNPMGRGAWRATVHVVAKSWIWLCTKWLSTQWPHCNTIATMKTLSPNRASSDVKGVICAYVPVLSGVSDSLQTYKLSSTRLFSLWYFSGENTGVGCHFFLQAIFPTKGLNLHLLCLLHCRWVLYHWATGEV